jgi:hypothetical protein
MIIKTGKFCMAAVALLSFASCASETTVVEGPRTKAPRSKTTTQTETTVEEPAPVSIPSKPPRSDGNYLRHDGG